jgi:hypothetical protein
MVREDPRFAGRFIEVMRLRIDVLPVQVRRSRNAVARRSRSAANGTTGGKRRRRPLVDK